MKTKDMIKATIAMLLLCSLSSLAESSDYIRSRAQRDAMSPTEILNSIKAGNHRFVEGDLKPRNFRQEQMATKGGQHPGAVV